VRLALIFHQDRPAAGAERPGAGQPAVRAGDASRAGRDVEDDRGAGQARRQTRGAPRARPARMNDLG